MIPAPALFVSHGSPMFAADTLTVLDGRMDGVLSMDSLLWSAPAVRALCRWTMKVP
ncbi:MAG: hypothetical protein JOZ93_07675 [Sinobacteraceae bacterium]|nr:hypothetical protein [Nevskiaceae bacterium]